MEGRGHGGGRRRVATVAVALVLGAAAAWVVAGRLERKPLARNAIVVLVDTLRADHLGCYGYTRPTSPTIDRRLAGEGALFERAYSAFPITHASHMTVFTGLPPCVHGIGVARTELAADVATLPQIARAAGWTTAAFTEDGVLNFDMGFGRGFGTYVENTEAAASAERRQVRVPDSARQKLTGQHLAVEPWEAAGAGKSAHVGHLADLECAQKPEKLLPWVCRMADGEDAHAF